MNAAKGHNPFNLTDEVVGVGFRLLTLEEIEHNDEHDVVNRFNPDFYCWSQILKRWETGFDGNNITRCYRIKRD